MTTDYRVALAEIAEGLAGIDDAEVERACERIAGAGAVVGYGCGREGLQLRGFIMRLHHLGLTVTMQGDMAAPPVGPGDVLLASAGPGDLATVTALLRVARRAGATTILVTAEPARAPGDLVDQMITIPTRTMAQGEARGAFLPMGSVFEGALFVLFEVMTHRLVTQLGQSPEAMRARHTNLE